MMPSNGTQHRYGSRRVRITVSKRECADSGERNIIAGPSSSTATSSSRTATGSSSATTSAGPNGELGNGAARGVRFVGNGAVRHRAHHPRATGLPGEGRRSGTEVETDLAPPSLKRASNGLPDFDLKPLSTGLRPCFSSARHVRAVIRLSAMVFRFANLQQLCQRLHPNTASHAGRFRREDRARRRDSTIASITDFEDGPLESTAWLSQPELESAQ